MVSHKEKQVGALLLTVGLLQIPGTPWTVDFFRGRWGNVEDGGPQSQNGFPRPYGPTPQGLKHIRSPDGTSSAD